MPGLVEGNTQFAVDLYKQIKSTPGNLFFSPDSISTALAMTYVGAHGETAEQMAKVLHFQIPQDQLPEAFATLRKEAVPKEEKPGYHLSVANRLWGQQGFHFLPDFLAETRDHFNAELAQVDFVHDAEGTRSKINQWVEDQTHEKIKDLVPSGALTALTRLVLTNAIYFKGDWARPFDKNSTKDEPFHLAEGKDVTVPLMNRTDDFKYGEIDGLKVLELPYGKAGDLSAVFLLPDANDGLAAVEDQLSTDNLRKWTARAGRRKVVVSLPRFKVTSQFSLSRTLTEMGMPLAFDDRKADFSGISSEDKLSISAVIHKAFVDVNEEGTEAAAATAVVMVTRSAIQPQEPAVFRADHPFLFLIRDNRTKSILFLGRITNPAG